MNTTLKKLAAILLIFVMAISFCACSGSSEKATSASSAVTVPSADAALKETSGSAEESETPEYVYRAEFTKITGDENVSDMTARCYLPDGSGFYASGSVVTGSFAPEGVEPQYYGQFDTTESALFFIGIDGTVKKLENYKPIPQPEAEAGMYNFTAFSYISGFGTTGDGKLVVMEEVWRSWTDVEDINWDDENYSEHYSYDAKYIIRYLDETGAEVSRGEIVPESVNMNLYSNGTVDKDNNILFVTTTEMGESSIRAYNGSGELVYEIPSEVSISDVFASNDGTVYVSVWGNNGLDMMPLDTETKAFGEPVDIPDDAYSVIAGSGDYPMYYTSGVYLYGFDPASGGEAVKVLNWMDCDVNPDEVAYYKIFVDGEGVVRALLNGFDSYEMKYDRSLVSVKKVPFDPSAQKKELTVATQYLSWELRNAIIAFNRSSDSVRVVAKDYSEYNTEEDYSAGLTKLQTEIMAGNCPDIIDMNGLSLSQLSSKGLLEDLYPFIDKDEDISRDAFYPNVMKAAEHDGKLMHTVTSFTVNTVIGPSSIVGEEPGWTYDDLNHALLDMPEDCTAFEVSTTRDEVLNTCLNLAMEDLVSWDTGEVHFDSEEFIDMLKFAASFPESYDWETYDWQTDSPETRIREGRQMLYSSYISSVDNLMYVEASFNGMPVTFIGYPTFNGVGNTIATDAGYAMSSSCTDKDAAWSFLKQFFEEAYYVNNASYGLSPQKALLEKSLKKACTITYEMDDKGQFKLDEKGEKIPEQKYYGMDGNVYTYYCLSQEMADSFRYLVENTDRVSVEDQNIKDIVSKQAAAFFSGQKSAEDTAKLVQSNAKIYVNEQR